eukprot:gene10819-3437_t
MKEHLFFGLSVLLLSNYWRYIFDNGIIISKFLFNSFLWIFFFVIIFLLSILLILFGYLFTNPGDKTHLTSSLNERKKVELMNSSSTEWLNIILNKISKDFLKEINYKKILKEMINKSIKDIPNFIGEIKIEEFKIGSSLPKFYNIKSEEDEKNEILIIELEIEYEDKEAKIEILTELLLNEPLKHWASLPLKISIENFFLKSKMKLKFTKRFESLSFCLLNEPESISLSK